MKCDSCPNLPVMVHPAFEGSPHVIHEYGRCMACGSRCWAVAAGGAEPEFVAYLQVSSIGSSSMHSAKSDMARCLLQEDDGWNSTYYRRKPDGVAPSLEVKYNFRIRDFIANTLYADDHQ
jgi:hypothetical protein